MTPATGEYDEGAEVEIRAEANKTWIFSSWEGDVSGTENPAIIAVNDDLVFTAVFEKLQYPLNVNIDGGGTVEENIVQSKMTDYEIGTEVELNAVTDEGWVFVEWQGDITGTENPQTITMDEEKSVTAVFERKDYPLTISTEGEGNVSEEVIEKPAKDYAYETVVELTANSAEGWQFARWEGDLEGTDNPSQITIDGEKEVTAVFERQGYELTVNVTGEGDVNEELVEDASKTSYPFDSTVELTAEPNEGWEFDQWQGDLSGSDNPEEITIDEDKNVTAVFIEAQYELDLSTAGEGDGSISVEPAKDFYDHGDEIVVTANPGELSEFKEWDGDISGTDNPKDVTVTSDLEIIAIFGRPPEVETTNWSDMRVNSVTSGGDVTGNGGFEVTDRGVCWSTDTKFPNLSHFCTSNGDGTGSFTSNVSDLVQGATYYLRAYATNQAGTTYGETIEFRAGYVSHGYVEGVTPSDDSQFENRSYRLVKSNWKGGENKIWIELNLGATDYVKSVTGANANRAGWYFQFNRKQGYFHSGDVRVPDTSWDDAFAENSDWEINNDPCRTAFGGNWRVPTAAEWQSFYLAGEGEGGMESGDYNAVFSSLLRLHAAGAINTEGSITQRGSTGFYWSSDQVDSESATYLGITSGGSGTIDITKAGGLSIRCVKD